jgi:hypothetical protein
MVKSMAAPFRVRSYLNALLRESLTRTESDDLLRVLDKHGISEANEANYRESGACFSYKLPWLN